MTKKKGPIALIVIDGWGYSAAREGNAIALAETPFYDELSEKYPSTLLEAHGSRVGLPTGVMGNSEVGPRFLAIVFSHKKAQNTQKKISYKDLPYSRILFSPSAE